MMTKRVDKLAQAALREHLAAVIDHLDHILPGQAPLGKFVHHNTLHGFQHLPFEEALAEAWHTTGNYTYLPETGFRRLYRSGRITDADLQAVFAMHASDVESDPTVIQKKDFCVKQCDLDLLQLTVGIHPITPANLAWEMDERAALSQFAATVSPNARLRFMASVKRHDAGHKLPDHPLAILWQACLKTLQIHDLTQHAEKNNCGMASYDGRSFNADDVDKLLHLNDDSHDAVRALARQTLQSMCYSIGDNLTLSRFIFRITGRDPVASTRHLLIRYCAAYLDEGIASWPAPSRSTGFYAWWCNLGGQVRGGKATLNSTRFGWDPALDAMDTLIHEMRARGLDKRDWEAYLQSLVLELPGWSGMFNWRHHHAEHDANKNVPVELVDYLAVRLLLDRSSMDIICEELWGIAASLDTLVQYFEQHYSEFLVRHLLFEKQLPEHLAAECSTLIAVLGSERNHRDQWRGLAEKLYKWSQANASTQASHRCYDGGWRLFKLAQHLGLGPEDIANLSKCEAEKLLDGLNRLPQIKRCYYWLCAYENNYRQSLFTALIKGFERDAVQDKSNSSEPEAQLIFCMDDREEAYRRHLEEINPSLQTYGAAGFFGIAMNWTGIDDHQASALCPVVVTPAHAVNEYALPASAKQYRLYTKTRKLLSQLRSTLYLSNLSHLFRGVCYLPILAPAALIDLFTRTIAPAQRVRFLRLLVNAYFPRPDTGISVTAEAGRTPPQVGYTLEEQTDRVAALLKTIGLTKDFAPLIVLIGHGSSNENNPHSAAYNCGACSGKNGGPNARVFAAMANNPSVRIKLIDKGLTIPDATWFIAAEHNTCTDGFEWFDSSCIPAQNRASWHSLQPHLARASQLSALERCRRFVSAEKISDPLHALEHVQARAADISQVRPELGHASNAAAVIGRREFTRGIFLDRRVFLLSYDYRDDPGGAKLESLMLAAAPVGAGISLEYYFSTVNNEQFGCGSKVPHNITGWFGIMEGAASDLRTGLPQQMVEVHEAMRLQVIVEQHLETLIDIYQRQPALQELFGGGWVLLSALNPVDGQIYTFDKDTGFKCWQSTASYTVPTAPNSLAWFKDKTEPLPAALVSVPDTLH